MADYMEASWDKLAKQIVNRAASFQTSYPGGASFLPHNIAGQPFRASNALTLAAEGQAKGYADPRWITRTEVERQGGSVRAGQTATPVQFWNMVEGRPALMTAAVFNAEQTSGLPPYQRQIAAMADRADAVQRVVAGSNATIERTNGPASYDKAADVIRLPNHLPSDNPARQQQEMVRQLVAWTNHPSRIETAYDGNDAMSATRVAMRNEVATMLASDRLKIGFDGNHDPMLARSMSVLVRDRSELARAAMTGELVAQEITKFGANHKPELTASQMQALATKVSESARERAWAAAAPSMIGHNSGQWDAQVTQTHGQRL
jgi:putative DNA primase/helicase